MNFDDFFEESKRQLEEFNREREAFFENQRMLERNTMEETVSQFNNAISSYSNVIYCPNCGSKNDKDAKFCCECGTKIEMREAEESRNTYNKSDNYKIIITYKLKDEEGNYARGFFVKDTDVYIQEDNIYGCSVNDLNYLDTTDEEDYYEKLIWKFDTEFNGEEELDEFAQNLCNEFAQWLYESEEDYNLIIDDECKVEIYKNCEVIFSENIYPDYDSLGIDDDEDEDEEYDEDDYDDEEDFDEEEDNSNNNKCNFDLEDYDESYFEYKYNSKGKNKRIEVVINDGTLYIDDEELDITVDNLKDCTDIHDCGVVIAKHVIKDNDSNVYMTFNYCDSQLTEVPYEIELDKNLNYKKTDEEDCNWQLYLSATNGVALTRVEYYELNEQEFEDVSEFFEEEDTDAISDFCFDQDPDVYETLHLWGNEDEERLDYEVYNDENEVIEEGDICVMERNVFKDIENNDGRTINKDSHPDYLLILTDTIKRANATFNVPAGFQVGSISFVKDNFVDDNCIYCEQFGDTITNICTIRHEGKYYYAEVIDDAGTYGDQRFFLYEWDNNENRYELIGEC